jgi:branched-chain amino acid transport system ATP-binding protein
MLTIEKLSGFYGKKQVLFDIDLTLPDRCIGAVLGLNGAGKSTLLRAIYGLLPVRRGSIMFDGQDLSTSVPARNIAAGVAFVPQGARVFRDMTVGENLLMGGYTLPARLLAERREETLAMFPILRERAAQKAGALSGGERQMLALGMVLQLRPRLLLIDEPSIGLAPMLVTQLFHTLCRVRDEHGAAILIVEQQTQRVLEAADQVFVIRAGALVSHGPAAGYRGEDVLRQAYLNETAVSET